MWFYYLLKSFPLLKQKGVGSEASHARLSSHAFRLSNPMDLLRDRIWGACCTGDIAALRHLLSSESVRRALSRSVERPDAQDTAAFRSALVFDHQLDGYNAVNMAAIYDRPDVLDCLRETEPADSFWVKDARLWTLLHHAVDRGSVRVVNWVIRNIPGLSSARTVEGLNPIALLLAGPLHRLPAFPCDKIHSYPVMDPRPILPRNKFEDTMEIQKTAKALLKGNPLWAIQMLDSRDGNGNTPLLLSIEHRRPFTTKILLAFGADPNAMNGNGIGKKSARDKILALSAKKWKSSAWFGGNSGDPALDRCVDEMKWFLTGRMTAADLLRGLSPPPDHDAHQWTSNPAYGQVPDGFPNDDGARDSDEWFTDPEGSVPDGRDYAPESYSERLAYFQDSEEEPSGRGYGSAPDPADSWWEPDPSPAREATSQNRTIETPEPLVAELPDHFEQLVDTALVLGIQDLDSLADAVRRLMVDTPQEEITIEAVLDRMELDAAQGSIATHLGEQTLAVPTTDRSQSRTSLSASDSAQTAEAKSCVICLEGVPAVALIPCGHMILCLECNDQGAVKVGDGCPVCRRSVSSLARIFT